jgi:hypothetical protein
MKNSSGICTPSETITASVCGFVIWLPTSETSCPIDLPAIVAMIHRVMSPMPPTTRTNLNLPCQYQTRRRATASSSSVGLSAP